MNFYIERVGEESKKLMFSQIFTCLSPSSLQVWRPQAVRLGGFTSLPASFSWEGRCVYSLHLSVSFNLSHVCHEVHYSSTGLVFFYNLVSFYLAMWNLQADGGTDITSFPGGLAGPCPFFRGACMDLGIVTVQSRLWSFSVQQSSPTLWNTFHSQRLWVPVVLLNEINGMTFLCFW